MPLTADLAECGWITFPLACFMQIQSRGLPDNLTGPIRVMIIEGLDENLCCGTHVSNLAHLQVGGISRVTCVSGVSVSPLSM